MRAPLLLLAFHGCFLPEAEDRCARRVVLRASADDGAFVVPKEGRDAYPCFAFQTPFAASEHITSWQPVIDDPRVTHHWLLYRTPTAQPNEGYIGECEPSGDGVLVMGWSPGGEGGELPAGVGLEAAVTGEEWMILQLHYLDASGLDGEVRDESGVEICVSDRPQPVVAGILTTGDVVLDIPPRARDHVEERLCLHRLSEPLHVVAASPHMHRLGTGIETAVRRGGAEGPEEVVLALPSFDYDYQTTYPVAPEVVVQPGDVIRTTCTYDNPTDDAVTYGVTIDDEMCFNFLTVYPITAFGTEPRVCR